LPSISETVEMLHAPPVGEGTPSPLSWATIPRREDAAHDRRRGLVFLERRLRHVRPAIAVGRSAAGEEPTGLDTGKLAALGSLRELLVLDLGGKRLRGADEAPDRRILEVFGHERQPSPVVFGLLGQDREVGLVATEAVERVGDDHVDLASADAFAQRFEGRTVAVLGPRVGVGEGPDDVVAALGAERPTARLLGLEGRALILLSGGADAAIDGRAGRRRGRVGRLGHCHLPPMQAGGQKVGPALRTPPDLRILPQRARGR
jgi:hypothetical protein